MASSTDIQSFVGQIMGLNTQHMTPFMGFSSGTDVLYSLKASTVAFANASMGKATEPTTLVALSGEVEGYLQTLQVLNILSPTRAETLIAELRKLS